MSTSTTRPPRMKTHTCADTCRHAHAHARACMNPGSSKAKRVAEGLHACAQREKGAAARCWRRQRSSARGAEKETVVKLPCQASAQGCWWQQLQVQKPQPRIARARRSAHRIARSVHNAATNDHDRALMQQQQRTPKPRRANCLSRGDWRNNWWRIGAVLHEFNGSCFPLGGVMPIRLPNKELQRGRRSYL